MVRFASMTKEQSWTSGDLAALHGELIRELYEEGLGRKSLALAVSKRTGTPCSTGVMCRTLKALDLKSRKGGKKANRKHARNVLSTLTKVPPSPCAAMRMSTSL